MTEPEPRDPRIDAAYRDAATDAPRAEVDDRIRAAAHRAAAAGPQSLETRARADARRSWIARWRVPVSIAATVVVAVTLAYMMEREEVQLTRTDGVPAGAPTAAVVAQAEKIQSPAPAAAPSVSPKPENAPRPDSATARRLDEAVARRRAEIEAAQNKLDARTLSQRPTAAERSSPAPEAARPSASEAPAPSRAFSVERDQRQSVGEARLASPAPEPAAPAAAPPSAVPAAPAPAPAAKLAPLPAREAAGAAARDRALADRPERMERQTPIAEQKVRTPEEWVEDLRRLKAQRRDDDFARELAEFRKRYPDFKLPADLLQ
jgi:hypothetical protein